MSTITLAAPAAATPSARRGVAARHTEDHIEGRYRPIPAAQLAAAAWLYTTGRNTRRQLRVYFAVHEMADPAKYDAIVVTNLCVPTASGVPLKMLPKEIDGVRIVGIDVPGFGIPTHAEAKDVLAGAMLNYARGEIASGQQLLTGT